MIFAVELVLPAGAGGAPRGLREHRAYWDGLAGEGVLIAGGPWQDGSGELLLCRAPDRAAVLRLLEQDPYLRFRTVTRYTVRAWQPAGDLSAPPAPAAPSTPAAPPVARRAGRPAAAAGALTPHEERVAAMAVAGMTNRAIAAALSVSTRAVELQMTRIYRKLAIRRRAQLALALNGRVNTGGLPEQIA
ncbi:LuxR C-terminal-related transcriptional regulator [Kitasatospora sp. NPDC090308]|uniref:LuxR C-terminal-related transcriptional regulator n=1 Tax=Kitasatospora sp. NPDC090308 TaxID=3364082 RepID=UPI0037F2302C